MKIAYYLLFLTVVFACRADIEPVRDASPEAVHQVLDQWHQAAAEADFESYFSYFKSDSSIFMGTDATERWTVAEFKPWSKPYFERGDAWNFKPVERHLYFADNGRTAWFDESLSSDNLGPLRGTGVLTFEDNRWKIVHYNLSIPIPNAIVEDVVRQIENANSTRNE